MSAETHTRHHQIAKAAASEALNSAIKHIRDVPVDELPSNHTSLLSDLTAAYSRVYSAQLIADAILATQTPKPPAT